MKLNTKRATSIFKKSDVPFPDFDFSGSEDLIFPFEVKTGFVNATEQGIVFDPNISDYARFERIFTGFEAVSAIWKSSTFLTDTKPIKKVYKAGEAQLWHYDSVELADDFSDLTENTDFLKERVVKTATYFTKNKIYDEDILNLYIIPGKFNKTIFYIKSVEEYHQAGTQEYLYSKVVLHSLNDKLANTGLAIDQYIQFSAPGEGYAYPFLIDKITEDQRKTLPVYDSFANIPSTELVDGAQFIITNYVDDEGVNQGEIVLLYKLIGTNKNITNATNGYIVNTEFLKNFPIVSAQLEIYSPSILSSVYAYGRPINNASSSGEELKVSRPLFIENVNVPDLTQRDVTKPLSQNTSWYWIPRSRMEIESFYDNWIKKTQGNWNPAILKKWLGYLRVAGADYEKATAPLGLRIFSGIFTLGISEAVFADLEKEVPNTGYWEFNNMQNLSSLFMRNFYIHKNTPRLPLDYKESIPWTLKDIPLIGGQLNKLSLGLPIGWKEQSETGGKNYNISGLISQSLLDFYKNTFIGVKRFRNTDYTGLPFGAFSDETQQSTLSPGEFATIINFDFTDKWFKDSTNSDLSPPSGVGSALNTSTIGFGQRVNEKSIPAPRDSATFGYAIDAFGFHALGSGTWKITLFGIVNGEKKPVFNGTYKTLSKLTNSIRDWNNNVKLSHWNSNTPFDTRIKNDPPVSFKLPADINTSTNSIENGEIVPVYETDTTKTPPEIITDPQGNPIQKLDTDGTPLFDIIPKPLAPYAATKDSNTIIIPPINAHYGIISDVYDKDRIELVDDLNARYGNQFAYFEANGFVNVTIPITIDTEIEGVLNNRITTNFISTNFGVNNDFKDDLNNYILIFTNQLYEPKIKDTFKDNLVITGTISNGILTNANILLNGKDNIPTTGATKILHSNRGTQSKQFRISGSAFNSNRYRFTADTDTRWVYDVLNSFSNNTLNTFININEVCLLNWNFSIPSLNTIETGTTPVPGYLFGFKKKIKLTFGNLIVVS